MCRGSSEVFYLGKWRPTAEIDPYISNIVCSENAVELRQKIDELRIYTPISSSLLLLEHDAQADINADRVLRLPPGMTWPTVFRRKDIACQLLFGHTEKSPEREVKELGEKLRQTAPSLKPVTRKALTARVELLHQPAPDKRYELRTADDLALQPPALYRVKNIFFRDAIAAIFGQSGGGKSFAAIDLAFSISDGNDWFGYRVEPCDVLYIALEGQAGLAQRVKAVREKRGAEAGKRVKFMTSPFSLMFSDDIAALIATVKDAGIRNGVIMLDTLNAAIPGADENASADMGRAIAATKRIREECGGLVILIHHSGKDATKGLRGHSSLHAALDTVIEVTRDGDRRCWKLAKAKDGRDGVEHQFRLDVLEVGLDEDGDPITSCVVVPEESTADAVRRAKVPAGGNQRIVWDAVNDLLRDSRAFGQGNAPPTRPCIELEAAIEKISPRLATDPKRRNERTRNAITGLVNRGLLKLDGGIIWLP